MKSETSSETQESAQLEPSGTIDTSWIHDEWSPDEGNDGWSLDEWNDDWSSVGWHDRALSTTKHSLLTDSELAVYSSGAGSSGPGVNDTMSAAATAVGKCVPSGKHSATTGSVFALSSGEAGSSWTRACGTTSTAGMAAVCFEARLAGIAKQSATTASAVARSVGLGEARLLGVAKHRA